MARFDLSVQIARPPEDVFAYLTDLDNLIEWQASLVEVRPQTPPPLAAGSRFTEVRSALGRRIESDVEVKELEPPRRFTVRSTGGPLPFTVEHELEPAGDGTTLRVAAEGEPKGALRLGGPMVMRRAEAAFRSDFERLKQRLESS